MCAGSLRSKIPRSSSITPYSAKTIWLKQIKPKEAELKAFYERNKATYNNSIPEKRKVQYVVLDTAKIEAGVSVSHEDLQAYYDQHRDDYRVPEQVNVSHILIKTPLPGPDGKVDPKGVEEARKKAEDVLKQLKAGGNFAELAKKYSEDPGSGKNGGSLGWIGKGRTVPEFEQTAFSLAKGATSGLVQSSYGFHIIRLDDKQAAHVKPLDEVKDQIEGSIKQQKAAQAAANQVNALLAQARSAGLDKAAAAKGLNVISTDFVSRTDTLAGHWQFAAVHERGVWPGRKVPARPGADSAGLCRVPGIGDQAGFDSHVRRDSQPGRRRIQERARCRPAYSENPGAGRSRQGRT